MIVNKQTAASTPPKILIGLYSKSGSLRFAIGVRASMISRQSKGGSRRQGSGYPLGSYRLPPAYFFGSLCSIFAHISAILKPLNVGLFALWQVSQILALSPVNRPASTAFALFSAFV